MQQLQRVTANYAMVSPRLQINEHDWLTYSWELVGRGAASSLGSIIGDEPTPTSAAVGSSAAIIAFSASRQHVNSHWHKTTHINDLSVCLFFSVVHVSRIHWWWSGSFKSWSPVWSLVCLSNRSWSPVVTAPSMPLASPHKPPKTYTWVNDFGPTT